MIFYERPIWRASMNARTPYAAFERWRTPARIGFYSVVLVMVAGLTWVSLARTVQVASWLQRAPNSQRILAIFSPVVVLYVVALMVLLRLRPRRRIREFEGRCLHCGEPRLSEFLDVCSSCNSDLHEQDSWKRMVLATRPKCGEYRGLKRMVPELRRCRRRVVGWTVASGVAVAVCFAFLILENAAMPRVKPRPITMTCVLSVVVLLASATLDVTLWARYEIRRQRANADRLRGRCLECEEHVTADEEICSSCGCSIVHQKYAVAPRPYKGLSRPVAALRSRWVLANVAFVTSMLLILGCMIGLALERGAVEGTSGLGRLPIGICAVSAIGCVAAVLWACSIDRRMARHNLRRLTGCCLQCEAARDRAQGSCRACGSDYRIQDTRVEHL